jgi:predicted Rossmann-fold nucleotide-binding protein
MITPEATPQIFRGLLQTADGLITRVSESNGRQIRFQAAFNLSDRLIECIRHQPQDVIFSERSRIARLGVQIKGPPLTAACLDGRTAVLDLTATQVIAGYPGLDLLRDFFTAGLPVGRLVYCDPDALMTSDQVLAAIEDSALKLPASTSISSDGSIVISPHRVVCELKEPIGREVLGRILIKDNGREILGRHQVRRPVSALKIPAGEGVITTCSMYLNEHYVVLQSGFELGGHLPATILDPIKTRGIRIYLEIVNRTAHLLVNPLITAKIYRAPTLQPSRRKSDKGRPHHTFEEMQALGTRLNALRPATCHFLDKPVALLAKPTEEPRFFVNGPDAPCPATMAECAVARRDFSVRSCCAHQYATAHLGEAAIDAPSALVLKYFPNIIEHRDIINVVCDGKIDTLYFLEPSREHGPFLSQNDHSRLQEYHTFGVQVFWSSSLTRRIMAHTMRDGMGYFVTPDRLSDFHKSMLFAFYGSTTELDARGVRRLEALLDALVDFWGRHIGIVTGGGSGVMEKANTLAKARGILSGANFLEITDQAMTTDVDFCQVFQSTCRHSRQKWFEVASFPIFNVGGLGTLEELGITLCNMKLSIMEPVPIILFDTEGDGRFWADMTRQIHRMVEKGRAPAWVKDNIVITHDPREVIDAYRERLQLF